MANFFTSLFSGKNNNTESEQQKNNRKKFEMFKFDGLRAQRIGRMDYALKCFNEALAIEEEFETMGYLSQLYIGLGELAEARKLLEKMHDKEPEATAPLLVLANVCYMQEDYSAMEQAARTAIGLDAGEAVAHALLGKARKALSDNLMAIAHLTQAIALKEDFHEALLLRAESLLTMQQYAEAGKDLTAILESNPEDEAALLLRGRLFENNEQKTEAEAVYRNVIELNPFHEQAYLHLARLFLAQKKVTEAVAVLDDAIELNPQSAEAYKMRGEAKFINGDKDGSVEDLKRALELKPEEGAALNGKFATPDNGREAIPGIF